MASWKKVIVSGSNAHLTSITASQVPLSSGTSDNVLVRASTGEVREIAQSSLLSALSAVTGSGTQNYITRWSGTGTITTSSIYETSNNIGIGTNFTNPSARLHISGASNSGLLEIDSPAVNNIIYVSGSGRVGIGTGTPTATLDVNGSSSFGGTITINTNTNKKIAILNSGVGANNFSIQSDTDKLYVYNDSSNEELISIQKSGMVAVGAINTLDVSAKLHISGSSESTLLKVSSPNSNNALFVSGSGRVGIGTASPSNTLQVAGGITAVNITASGNISGSGNLSITGNETIGGTSTITGRLTANGALTTTNLTASATPLVSDNTGYNIVLISSSGELVKIASLPSGSITGINSFATINVGGVTVTADSSADTLTINSGSFAGSANTNNNLLISASQDDVITFSFNDSPIFTNITASGNISGSGNLSITGTSTLTGRLSANGAITTTNITASGNISSSAGLIGATLNTSGNGTIGGNLTTTQITSSGNISSSAGLIGATLTTSGDGTIGGTLTVTSNATVGANLTVTGDLTVNGTTTIINTTNISIEDKFILLASGSGTTTDGGIIVQTTSGSSGVSTGSALFYNGTDVPAGGSARWGLNNNVVHNADTVAPTDYLVSVSASNANPLNTVAPTYGSASAGFGNVHINRDNNTIWMYI